MSRSALILCLLAAVCGAARPSRLHGVRPDLDDRIVGGEPVDIKQFPWQVSLEKYKDGKPKHFCGGSIISSTWVLSALHCTLFKTPEELCVRAGSSFRETGGTVYGVTKIIAHKDFKYSAKDYDFVLLQISKPISFGCNVQPVILGSSEIGAGSKVNVSGWGRTSEEGDQPEQLHAVTTTIVDRDTCKAAYADRDQNITERMICAGDVEGAKGAWEGDSGGALVVGNTQFGVTSFSAGCALPGFPDVYSYVPAVRSWITEKTGI